MALSEGAIREMFKIMLNQSLRDEDYMGFITPPYEEGMDVLNRLIPLGRNQEVILEGMRSLLASENEGMRADGLKVLDLLLENQQHYSADLKQKIASQVQNSTVSEAVTQAV